MPVQVVRIVCACSSIGYVPNAAEQLVQLASRTYHRLVAWQKYLGALRLLWAVTSLQLFLDNELSKLFTLETLEALDLYMAGISTCCAIFTEQNMSISSVI